MIPKDTFFTYPSDWCLRQRLDYILEVRITQKSNNLDTELDLITNPDEKNEKNKFGVITKYTKIEPHFTE